MGDQDRGHGSRAEYPTNKEAEAKGQREDAATTLRVGSWQIEMWWPQEGGGGPGELKITPHPDGDPAEIARGITTGTLRAIPLAQTVEERTEAAKAVSLRSARHRQDQEIEFDAPVRLIRLAVEADPKPGRKGRPDSFFLAVTQAYLWLNHWHHGNPVQRLASACGVERRLAANWVRLAREKDLLTEATEGFPGGELTFKAMDMLREKEGF